MIFLHFSRNYTLYTVLHFCMMPMDLSKSNAKTSYRCNCQLVQSSFNIVSIPGCSYFFKQFGRTKDWHLRELKMASRRTLRIKTQFFPTRSQKKYKLRELVRRIINPRKVSEENYIFFQLGLRRNTS